MADPHKRRPGVDSSARTPRPPAAALRTALETMREALRLRAQEVRSAAHDQAVELDNLLEQMAGVADALEVRDAQMESRLIEVEKALGLRHG